ncbi:MAG: DUF748 domain-containing protein [Candidatus Omnitrophica bacterium]|nr:DUF748 domain-containing protein [Candidatus Omnitrophota bacterium]
MKKIGLLFLILASFIFLIYTNRHIVTGMFLAPFLESKLESLFNMPIAIQGLRVDFKTGDVQASRVIFTNQPEFLPGPHLDVYGVRFHIDFPALRRKEVLIDTVHLERPYYLIDRMPTPEGPRNNVNTWYRYMKVERKKGEPKEKTGGEQEKKWVVKIGKIEISNGTVIFDNRAAKNPRKYVFRNLNGFLGNFEYPSEGPNHLSQDVEMKGTYGEFYPAPFEIEGKANFSTSQVGFNLYGEITEGDLLEHRDLWEGLPIRLEKGRFSLFIHGLCLKKQLQSRSHLILRELDISPGQAATDKIWGLPLLASMRFMENEKEIHLEIPVNGDITDPKFEFQKAFRASFHRSLERRTKAGIQSFTNGTVRLASQTKGIVVKTQQRLVEGIDRLSTAVHEKASQVE